MIALSIAIHRNYPLLTGDKHLRKAGEANNVTVRGTLWVFDELLRNNCITTKEYKSYMRSLLIHNGKSIRLPSAQIIKRLE
jgi:predicted nucleic acid-binding protein